MMLMTMGVAAWLVFTLAMESPVCSMSAPLTLVALTADG